MQNQFGSICNNSEHESDVHTVAVKVDYQATEKLKMNAGFTYNKAESSLDWNFTERAQVNAENAPAGFPLSENGVEGGSPYASVNDDNWQLNNLIDGCSSLSYQQYQLTVGGSYSFSERMYATAALTYDAFESDQEYVYGNADGDAYCGHLGFGYRF